MNDVNLPVTELFAELTENLSQRPVVLEAPPGAGKSTALPLFLLQHHALPAASQIILVQPRRVAAVRIAHYLAAQLAEPVGQQVGYQVRQERAMSAATRLLVMTDGMLTRHLQQDPELTGVGLVIFDEFHERSLHSDLSLALTLETCELRPELQLLLMSATLPGAELAAWLAREGHEARHLACTGRRFPVHIDYRPPNHLADWLPALPAVIQEALSQAERGVLVFVPGQREMRYLQRHLQVPADVTLYTLYGGLSLQAQQAVLTALPRGRKLVLSTNIAETSLTIPDIDVVVDSGRERQAEYHPGYQLTRLQTRLIAAASAEQRAGRAGRTQPGRCYRLWSASQQERLAPYSAPALAREDLSQLVLETRHWGSQPEDLAWYTPPATVALSAAAEQLDTLGLLTRHGLTPLGQAVAKLGTEPWAAWLLLQARAVAKSVGGLAALLVAWVEERQGPDVAEVPELMAQLSASRQRYPRTWYRFQAWCRRLQVPAEPDLNQLSALLPLALQARPALLAQQREQGQTLRLATGLGLSLPAPTTATAYVWVLDAQVHANGAAMARHFWPVSASEVLASPIVQRQTEARWQGPKGRLVRVETWRWQALLLQEQPASGPPTAAERTTALLSYLRTQLPQLLTQPPVANWLERVRLWRQLQQQPVAPWDTEGLLADVDEWATVWLQSMQTQADVDQWDMRPALRHRLGYAAGQQLQSDLPETWQAPSGRRHRIHYQAQTSQAIVELKLQEVFGTPVTPQLAGGRLPLTLALLSPAGRLLHQTRDLASFWQNAYPEVRKEMRGRYPKHPWPQDPTAAAATHLTKKAMARHGKT